jgi:hypothetical protein
MDSNGSGQGAVVGSWEDGNEPLGSVVVAASVAAVLVMVAVIVTEEFRSYRQGCTNPWRQID